MQEWEVMEFYNVINYSGYREWEQTRLILSCFVDHKKVKKLSDIIKFPWDSEYKKDEHKISNEDIARLKKMSEEYAKNMNSNING